MTQLARHPSYLLIEDRLDAIGQKYRVQRIVRGAMLFAAFAVAATVAAALAAHVLGQGRRTTLLAAAWFAWIVGSAACWVVRPLFMRPRSVDVARFIERKVEGLHNGLTNSVLLASAGDLGDNPYIPEIFDEVLTTARDKSLDEAVRMSDLGPLALRLLFLLAPAFLAAVVFHAQFAHGWRQMFAPSAFVPQTGAMEIADVQPGDVTLVTGQPLELTITAKPPANAPATFTAPDAKLIFDGGGAAAVPPAATLAATTSDDDGTTIRYAYRLDHVDDTLRYRVEVGGTQSNWFTATVVRKVTLQQLDLKITPPAYAKQPPSTISIKPEEVDKTPVTVPQGSRVEIGVSIDVPARAAVLQVGDGQQLDMTAAAEDLRFFREITALTDTTASVGLMQGQQIIAKIPENGLAIHVKPDAPPRVEMKWPTQDTSVPPGSPVTVEATIADDYGLTGARVLLGVGDGPTSVAAEAPAGDFASAAPATYALKLPLKLTPDQTRHGQSIRVQIEATDNRDLVAQFQAAGGFATPSATTQNTTKDDGGPQTAQGPSIQVKFLDPAQTAADEKQKTDKLRARLLELLKTQRGLMAGAVAWKPGGIEAMDVIAKGQTGLRAALQETADKFEFDAETRVVRKTLLMLAYNPAKDAIDLAAAILTEPDAKQQARLGVGLRAKQQHVISTLESLLAMLNPSAEPTTQLAQAGHDPLLTKADAYKKLDETLKEFMKQEQRVLDQTAGLAKKPVADFDDKDGKRLDDLKMAQEKLDAFLREQIADFSKNAEQDMSNPDLLKDLYQIQSEVTMAKDALSQKSAEIAVALEENGLELAREQSSNIEKWLANAPDRQKWTMEDPVGKTDTPMPELPKELEDMVGQLLEQEEDLQQDAEDANANWHDSMDKGVGWDAMDGPIADMSAKGVTGNTLPNNNEMDGRSGEGRSGKSQGEFVGDSAVGKGGRRTPTRLDPTPFQQGQIKDTSTDPTGGATGGGKVSGQGGAGLEGPVPPAVKQAMQRLAQKQAQLRNAAERLNLQYQLGRYDNFKLTQAIALMRRLESDVQANRYQNALRRTDVLVDALETSHMLLGGQLHVQRDTTPQSNGKTHQDISDAMKGNLPPAWSDALREYYQKLGQQ